MADRPPAALGGPEEHFEGFWYAPGSDAPVDYDDLPNPAADLTDAAKWMVPEGWDYVLFSKGVARLFKDGPSLGEVCQSFIDNEVPRPPTSIVEASGNGDPALALTLAGWATKEMER